MAAVGQTALQMVHAATQVQPVQADAADMFRHSQVIRK